jgi:NADH-quinone oxidoreductase subunit I
MSRDYEMVYTNREDAILGKDKLLVPVAQLQERLEYLRSHQYYEPTAA